MTERKKLKYICDLIGYKNNKYYYGPFGGELIKKHGMFVLMDRDVREIIFTPEFKVKLADYIAKGNINIRKKLREGRSIYYGSILDYVAFRLGENLDNPVDYLCNLLK